MSYRTKADYMPIADDLLRRVSVLYPSSGIPSEGARFEMLRDIWAGALASTGWQYWPNVYVEALEAYAASEDARFGAPKPGDVIAHVRKLITRIESDPVRGPKLREWRERRRDEIEAQQGL